MSAAAYIGAGSAETEAEYSRRRTANASALERFESGDVQWLVATCALGMGIDFKREVRAVLHIGFPPVGRRLCAGDRARRAQGRAL